MTTTMSPFRLRGDLMGDFRREFDMLMNRFFNSDDGDEIAAWTPRVNLGETDKNYVVSVDLPGMTPDDIEIELRHGDLWISGERKEDTEEEGQSWRRVERHYGTFRRVIRLGDDVDPEQVNAEYNDGVLTITVPKREDAQAKRIAVKAK